MCIIVKVSSFSPKFILFVGALNNSNTVNMKADGTRYPSRTITTCFGCEVHECYCSFIPPHPLPFSLSLFLSPPSLHSLSLSLSLPFNPPPYTLLPLSFSICSPARLLALTVVKHHNRQNSANSCALSHTHTKKRKYTD